MLRGKAVNTNFIIFGLTWPGLQLEPTIYHTIWRHMLTITLSMRLKDLQCCEKILKWILIQCPIFKCLPYELYTCISECDDVFYNYLLSIIKLFWEWRDRFCFLSSLTNHSRGCLQKKNNNIETFKLFQYNSRK
jgi:hypothetical protein